MNILQSIERISFGKFHITAYKRISCLISMIPFAFFGNRRR